MLVQKEKCNQCLFSDNRIVSMKRMKDIIQTCHKQDTFFVCHKSTVKGDNGVCCKGFWDKFKHNFNLGRIAQRLNVVREVTVK